MWLGAFDRLTHIFVLIKLIAHRILHPFSFIIHRARGQHQTAIKIRIMFIDGMCFIFCVVLVVVMMTAFMNQLLKTHCLRMIAFSMSSEKMKIIFCLYALTQYFMLILISLWIHRFDGMLVAMDILSLWWPQDA